MTEQPLAKKTVDVLDARMAYHERGEGRRCCCCTAIRPRPICGATCFPNSKDAAG